MSATLKKMNEQKGSFMSKINPFVKKNRQEKHNFYQENFSTNSYQTFFQQTGKPVWTPRNYEKFANEAYTKNVIAYRCISLISQSAASVPFILSRTDEGETTQVNQHPILKLLKSANPCCSGKELIESIIAYKMISGNAYVMAVSNDNGEPQELFVLRPDRVSIIAGEGGIPKAYQYKTGKDVRNFPINRISGRSKILHLKNFHPLNDWYGMSPIEAAAYSIDQHNEAGVWNQALLQNGAKPSGALVVKVADDGSGGTLSDDQFRRIKNQVDEQYSGAANAGRPLLLEGGMEWKEMSLSPKDMDFIESKHSSARDIALAFGVPPQILGIPGDNTYSNMVEARFALWEQTILPLLDNITNSLNNWLLPHFGDNLELTYDSDKISALSPRRELIWKRIKDADFMTINEKRQAVGLDNIEGGDKF